MKIISFLILSCVICGVFGGKAVVFWHGMGDFGKDPGLMEMKKAIEQVYPGVYVKSIQLGSNLLEDIENSLLMNVNKQIDLVCRELSGDARLRDGFHAVGFSQGGQFLRGLVQRCSTIKVSNLISIGGQHQGVFGLPKCLPSWKVCQYARDMVATAAYESFVQDHIVQAEYWHDPLREHEYKRASVFLADINQENFMNHTYKDNILKLDNMLLVMFKDETIVVPKESEWFGFYKPGQDKELYSLQESPLYTQDRLGLKAMLEQGRLSFIALDGDHLRFTFKWFKEVIIAQWLA